MSATIKDVAQCAGVSTATVSRVINNDPTVKPKNAEKVREAIKKCNFVPNFVARNLKSARSNTIGLVVSDISNPYFTAMAKVIESCLHEHGYDMLICSTDEDQAKEVGYLDRFMSNRVDGIILNTTGKNDDFIVELSKKIPLVLIERQICSPEFRGDYVGANNANSIYSMTQSLLRIGHRRIGFLNSELSVSTGLERMQGFTQAMHDAHIEVNKDYPYLHESRYFSYEGGYEGAEWMMAQKQPPTALIAANNTLALGVLSYLRNNHVRVPEDVSFMYYGELQNSELLYIDPSYATLSPKTMGERAARFLLDRLGNISVPNRQAIFESQIIIGKSIQKV